MRRSRLHATLMTLPLAFVLAACGASDDGASVRNIGGDGEGSASASGSGSASVPASGSGLGSSGSGSTASGVAAACAPVGDPADAEATVAVELAEWSIAPSGDVPSGSVALEAVNRGAEPHELVIVQGVAPGELPTDADGALVEDELPDGALVGEIEPFPGGEDCTGVFDLEPGTYTFLCNIVETEDDGTVESHLAEGMVTEVTVG